MALPAGTLDPTFDGYQFSDDAFVTTSAQWSTGFGGRVVSAALADGAAASRGKIEGRTLRLGGTIIGTSAQDAEAKLNTILSNLRGSDRVRYGRLDLYGNGHYWAQCLGAVSAIHLPGVGAIAVQFAFVAADPYRRADTLISLSESPTSSAPTVVLSFSSEFSGTAPRIPVSSLNLGNGWLKDEKVRIYNSTAGWRFEHVLTQALPGTGQDLVIDSEQGLVMEGTQVVGEGVSGSYPWIQGGVSNTLDFTGSDRFGTFQIDFWDRFLV